jgi:hypothetical protein
MDKSHLATIAITAAVTVLFRELFTWIVSFAKLTATKPATKEWARKLFNSRNILFGDELPVAGLGCLAPDKNDAGYNTRHAHRCFDGLGLRFDDFHLDLRSCFRTCDNSVSAKNERDEGTG